MLLFRFVWGGEVSEVNVSLRTAADVAGEKPNSLPKEAKAEVAGLASCWDKIAKDLLTVRLAKAGKPLSP